MSITTALVGTLLLTAVGASMDGGRMITTKMQLQSISDAAALMGATPEGISTRERHTLALNSIDNHVQKRGDLRLLQPDIRIAGDGKSVDVGLTAEVPLLFGAFLGGSTRYVSVKSRAEETMTSSLNAISISVILDLSDSMKERFDTGSRLANVKAALSDTFNMISTRFGGEAAAATQVSTGLYPFNWGMVDNEVVALEPGTATVIDALNFMAMGEGSVPSQSFEMAMADQIAAKDIEGTRDRFIVYITDGSVDNEKADEPGRYLTEYQMERAGNSRDCKDAKAAMDKGKRHLVNTNRNAINQFGSTGNGNGANQQLLPGLRFLDANEPTDEMLAAAETTLAVTTPRATPGSNHIRRLEEDIEELHVFKT